MADYETHEHDVLVIGAGGAGLRAAIEASAAGVSVGAGAVKAEGSAAVSAPRSAAFSFGLAGVSVVARRAAGFWDLHLRAP